MTPESYLPIASLVFYQITCKHIHQYLINKSVYTYQSISVWIFKLVTCQKSVRCLIWRKTNSTTAWFTGYSKPQMSNPISLRVYVKATSIAQLHIIRADLRFNMRRCFFLWVTSTKYNRHRTQLMLDQIYYNGTLLAERSPCYHGDIVDNDARASGYRDIIPNSVWVLETLMSH